METSRGVRGHHEGYETITESQIVQFSCRRFQFSPSSVANDRLESSEFEGLYGIERGGSGRYTRMAASPRNEHAHVIDMHVGAERVA